MPGQAIQHDGSALSFAQRRLWFLREFQATPHEYNVPAVLRLRGRLDVAALRRSLTAIADRHATLRTTVDLRGGAPVQAIAPPAPVPVAVENLAADPDGPRKALALAAERARQPFDLTRDAPLRAFVYRLGEEDHVLALVFHHIAFDGWSAGVFARELTALYAGFATGRAVRLPDLPVSYAEAAEAQRQALSDDFRARLLAYWRDRLGDLAPVELPTDHPRPPVRSGDGAYLRFTVDHTLARRLNDAAGRYRATPFMLLLAAFQVLLFRYTGQTDLAVAVPVAGRSRPGVEDLIGCFANTVVLRADLSGDPSFADLLRRVRDVTVTGLAHQDLPFEVLVDQLRLPRDRDGVVATRVVFAMESRPRPAIALAGTAAEPVPVDPPAHFDLGLTMTADGDRLIGELEYRTDLFDRSTAEAVTRHYRRLLESVAADPERPITRLDLLAGRERRELMAAWTGPATTDLRHRCLHELIAEQADRTPDATAVAGGGQRLTYRELDQRAGRLADHLRARGIGPERLVAVYLERSVEMVVALLGVLKAGGAYVPLEPNDPVDRLAAMLADAAPALVLTRQPLLARLPGGMPALALDAPWPPVDPAPAGGPGAVPDNAAFAIFTSGSTGAPKAAVVSHAAVVNFALAVADHFGLSTDDRFLQLAPMSFDVVAEEVFPALLRGAAVVVPPDPDTAVDPARLVELIEAERVTLFEVTVPHWHALVRALTITRTGLPRSVRLVITGGERASAGIVEAWRDFGIPLVHVYGLTEAAVTSTLAHVAAGPDPGPVRAGRSPLPLGLPIANTSVRVLDRNLNPLPVGVPGELFVGGAGLARCYLGRPALTAARFLPDPHAGRPGERMYRTGDLVRTLPDGALEFLGRADHQVKVRGHRIEPGEVEAALLAHPAVDRAVALCRGDGLDKQLVAYVVPGGGPAPTADGLRDFLRLSLPDYMVPSAFVTLPDLPLTPSGKLDRRRLPAPEPRHAEPAGGVAGPRDPVEELIVRVWREILGVDRVGVSDNFFDLGGHSLKAMQVAARLREDGELDVSLRALFEHQTPGELARALREAAPHG